MLACPFHIPRYEWSKTAPLMVKCAMCFDRSKQGLRPACVEACPNEALIFGDRDELLAEAHERINGGSGTYLPRVWGEHEFGGTSILYISDVDLGAMGWPARDMASIPSLTEPLISKTPVIGAGVACSLLALNWVIGRRMKLASEGQSGHGDRHGETGNGRNHG
jgi:formate dehydrogenase iron-sulfur subunit